MTREEAIKIVRNIYQTDAEKEALAVLVPELSEDERIRKAIRLILIATEDEQKDFYSTHGLTRKDCTDWLERQKEQKVDIDKIRRDLYQSGYNDGYQHGKEDAQKEQKPAEWSEEGEKMIKSILFVLESYVSKAECEQSPALTATYPTYYKEIDWLKSLRPSWKPSEQEKGALRTAISVLTEERSFPKAAANLQTILDAFDGKETRKEWKPSEEQMEAFSSYIKDFQEKAEAAVGGWNNFDVMIRLYEQLKKLM